MDEIFQYLRQHGLVVLFVAVLGEQLGLPLPAAPVLLAVGALAGDGYFSAAAAVALAGLASLLSDSVWYGLGRVKGASILNLLCRISLEPESCVSTTKSWFSRLGASSLLIAKFVPGLSTAAPPMAGATGMPLWKFVLFDGAGGVIWAGAFILLGIVFRHQVTLVLEWAAHFGGMAAAVLFLIVAAYVGGKFWQRRRFILSLRAARITPEEVVERLAAGEPVTIVDLRHSMELGDDGLALPGAIWMERKELDSRYTEIPPDRDIILYCS